MPSRYEGRTERDTMKTSHVAQVLRHTIPAGLPTLILGKPGIAKTSLPIQVSQELGRKVIVSHPGLDDPTAGSGMPWPDPATGRMLMLPRAELAEVLRATEPTTWIHDDLTQAVPAVQNAYRPWYTARRIGDMVLPDCVSIVATGNRVSDRSDAKPINANVKSGFHTIIEQEPDVEDWVCWGLTAGIEPWILAFVRYRGLPMLCAESVAAGTKNEHNPRTIHHASDLFKLGLPAEVLHEAIAGACGEGWAVEAIAFRNMLAACVSADQIIGDPHGAPLPDGPGQCFATMSALAMRADVPTFDAIAIYLERMAKADKAEFARYCIADTLRRKPTVQATPGYLRLTLGEYGKLLGGDVEEM